MDLGTRVKNVLNSPESTVASKGEVDSNTPGAYPADADTPVTESGPDTSNPAVFGSQSTHNKLHKRNDPRGWAEDTTDVNSYKDYYYPNGQNARTLWYHDHAIGKLTSRHEIYLQATQDWRLTRSR